ncbi:zinc finger protein 638-like [Cheilinus undulatus]|uniref:zinc finger protein 638-like n=1 Tax=Cheilinus undulatus TaxID=241271 RepID=UPI001BD6380C|nr:zinc finger protein 638-like [Cheilinus undulatus]
MQKTNKKKRAQRTSTNLTKAAHHLAVHTDSNSRLVPALRLEPTAALSIANSTRGTHFIFGPVASAAAIAALRLAQITTQTQVALQQLATLATITVSNQYHNNNGVAAALPPHIALLSLLNRQQVLGLHVDTNRKTYRNAQPCLSAAMYHHHSQQPGSFPNGPRPPHHPPPPNQHQNRNSSDMLSQAMGFQFPRPTQLPDELESALAIRGARDMDHRLIDHTSRPNQHQNQSSGSGMSQHGGFGSNPMTLPPDNHSSRQQGVDWSNYQPPTKLFSSPPPHQSQRHQGPPQQPQSSHAGTGIQNWKPLIGDSQSPQGRHPQGGGESQGMYTPESAGSILASFGLSNEDLEVLSHYPDDQLTPDTLPFILRDIQINKSGTQNAVSSTSGSSFSHGIQDMPMPPSRSPPLTRSRSPEVPSLLAVTQTAGKVIDYGHASRAKDETTRKTFKREQLSSERTVKMYQSSSPPSSAPKAVKSERRQVRLEPTEPSKHGDQDYRRTSSEHRKSSRSPGREFQPSSKPRTLDRDYRREAQKPRPSSETSSEASSRRSPSSSSSSKPHTSSSSKKLPTPTMISDFSAAPPKVYPHTCSLCQMQCDEEKDWVDHINTVNHTAACRDLRNKYPDWKPNLPSRSGRHGSRASHSPSHSASRSVSCSLSPSPTHGKHRVGPPHHRPQGRPYPPHHHPRHHHYTGDPPCSGLKRPYADSKFDPRHPSSFKTSHASKHGPSQSSTKTNKSGSKPGAKTTKTGSGKASDMCAKAPPAKKKKKAVTSSSQDSSVADRLVYLTGIPKDASEQEVTDLVGSFGKINNVILMPCSEEESEKGEGQKASVCMLKSEDAQALANSPDLQIREQKITALTAKKLEEGKSSDNSTQASGLDKGAAAGAETGQKTSDEKGIVLITGLPDSGWSESDIIELVQPFGSPSDIIIATQIGKALVSVLDMETAQEMVKVNSFMPLKIKDAELKIFHIKQNVSLSTPVALYNLLMGLATPLESPALVGWSSLLVISNVPDTPSGSSEVQKLVRRFGTVIKTLVVNGMVICEMATAAMALSVYKRFQTFPCIIHRNPLFFSRKADPRMNTQTKIISAYLDSTEETPANGKDSQTSAAAEEEETAAKEDSGSPVEASGKDINSKEEKAQSTEEMVVDEASREKGSKDEEKDNIAVAVSEPLTSPDAKPEEDLQTNMTEESVVETVTEAAEENKPVDASQTGEDQTADDDKVETQTSDGEENSQEKPAPELPKVNQEKVKTPVEEGKTSKDSKSTNKTAAPSNEKQEKTLMEKEPGGKPAAETKEKTKNQAEEAKRKAREKEQKEREAKKEREKKERERRALEKEERVRKEKEKERAERTKRERERREEERRERERRERKRMYGEESTRWRSSSRSEGHKKSSEREEQRRNSTAAKKVQEEEEFDDFPFNMSDFVTVDEVGDVADLANSPSIAAPMETSEVKEDAAASEDQQDTPSQVAMETETSEPTVTQLKSEPESEASSNVPTGGLVPSDPTSGPSPTAHSQSDASNNQMNEPTCQPEGSETKTTQMDTTCEVNPVPTPADLSSNAPEMVAVKAEREEEEECDQAVNNKRVKEEVEETAVSDTAEEHEHIQEEDAQTVKQERSEDQTNNEEESIRKKIKTETPTRSDKTLPPFDPSNAVVKQETSEDQTNTEEETVRKKIKRETPTCTFRTLPPYDPSNPVGMEYLVPKTGFFCKVCNRFFSGTKEVEISHCKSLKHYENLQKFLKTRKKVDEAT